MSEIEDNESLCQHISKYFCIEITLHQAEIIRRRFEGNKEPLLLVRYECPTCGHKWKEEWFSACDSECPRCGEGDISALSWEETAG